MRCTPEAQALMTDDYVRATLRGPVRLEVRRLPLLAVSPALLEMLEDSQFPWRRLGELVGCPRLGRVVGSWRHGHGIVAATTMNKWRLTRLASILGVEGEPYAVIK
jgi:hypothetical protein